MNESCDTRVSHVPYIHESGKDWFNPHVWKGAVTDSDQAVKTVEKASLSCFQATGMTHPRARQRENTLKYSTTRTATRTATCTATHASDQ